jgi:hypothetical protein
MIDMHMTFTEDGPSRSVWGRIRWVLAAALLVSAGMVAFPPWRLGERLEYGWVFQGGIAIERQIPAASRQANRVDLARRYLGDAAPAGVPKPATETRWYGRIDFDRLGAQFALVWLVAGVSGVLLAPPTKKPPRAS